MNIQEFEATLPSLPEGFEWKVSTYMIDTFKFGWELQIIRVEKGGWFGLFDKQTRMLSALTTTYNDVLPEKEVRERASVMSNNLKTFLDRNKSF